MQNAKCKMENGKCSARRSVSFYSQDCLMLKQQFVGFGPVFIHDHLCRLS
jgi:hypothetical protein